MATSKFQKGPDLKRFMVRVCVCVVISVEVFPQQAIKQHHSLNLSIPLPSLFFLSFNRTRG